MKKINAPIILLLLALMSLQMPVFVWAEATELPEPQADEEVTDEAEAPVAEEPTEPETPAGSFTPVSADEEAAPDDQAIVASSKGLDELVSLDLRNIEASDALRFLAQKGGMNLAVSKNVSGRVQLLLNNVPIRDILDIILITNQLAYEKIGDVYYIMTEAEYKDRFGRKFSDTRAVKLFKIRYAIPEQVFSLFDVLKSDIGRLLVDPESGTVLVMDTQENLKKMEEALTSLEQKKEVKVYPLKYGKAVDIESRLKTRLDAKKVGTAVADERTNSIIVDTLPDRMEEIDKLVGQLDTKTKQVMIDVKIVQCILSNNLSAEVQWEGMLKQFMNSTEFFLSNHPINNLARVGTSFIDDNINIAPTARPTAGAKSKLTENLILGGLGKDQFELLINLIKTLGETKILSNPKISVVSNQEARIHIGDKQAYVTTTTTTSSGGGNTVAENVTFIDVGIKLAVTPVINEDGFVTMKIKPEVSSVSEKLTTPSGNEIPIVNQTEAETSVMVRDGVSILIGGLRQDTKTENRKKVPILGDIPILGVPFNSFSTTHSRTELLILITPHILYGNTLVMGEEKAVDKLYKTYTDYSADMQLTPVNIRATEPPAPVEFKTDLKTGVKT